MRKLGLFLLLVCTFVLSGCATSNNRLTTPSGLPDVTILGATKKQVADKIVEGALTSGSQVKSVNEYAVVIGKRATNDLGAQIFFGSRYDGVPEYRMHFGLLDVAGGVRVIGRAEIITNPGSAFERVSDVTATNATEIQKLLEKLAQKFNSPATSNSYSGPELIQPPSKAIERNLTGSGSDSRSAENAARQSGCAKQPQAQFLAKGAGYENYSIACDGGETQIYRCEYGNCRVLK